MAKQSTYFKNHAKARWQIWIEDIPNFSISCGPQTTLTFAIFYFFVLSVSVFQYKDTF